LFFYRHSVPNGTHNPAIIPSSLQVFISGEQTKETDENVGSAVNNPRLKLVSTGGKVGAVSKDDTLPPVSTQCRLVKDVLWLLSLIWPKIFAAIKKTVNVVTFITLFLY
jgi:hypothetical protein